ncbi:hypothetical protein [Pseudomonas sp. TE3610]
MYAIIFRLDADSLELHPGAASEAVEALLASHGLAKQTPGFHMGGTSISPVHCVLAIQAICEALPWFVACVKDLRLLRIGAVESLIPVLHAPHKQSDSSVRKRWDIAVEVNGERHELPYEARPLEEELTSALARLFAKYGLVFQENMTAVRDCVLLDGSER